jgi:MFS transporter, DHA2 family, multidrug resistance protein
MTVLTTLRDPDYLTARRTELRRRPFSFDGVELSLLVVVIVCWEVTLSTGQERDCWATRSGVCRRW